MNVTQVIKNAATYLQLDDVLSLEVLGGEVVDVSDQTEKNLALLLKCVNLVYDEIAAEYIPLKTKETVTVTNGKILFSELEKPLIQVYMLKNMNKMSVKYRIYPNFIEVENGVYEIEYSYRPQAVVLTGELEDFSNKISERVFSYAVAGEYALITGLLDEATTWKTRFDDAIKVINPKKSNIQLKGRGGFNAL